MATPTISVTPGKLNFKIRKGSTLRRTVTYYTDTTQATPIDLTGCTARMQIRDEDGVLLYALTTENGGLTLGDAAGTITFYLSDTDTAAVTGSAYTYDFELVDTILDVHPLVAGSFTFLEQVTV